MNASGQSDRYSEEYLPWRPVEDWTLLPGCTIEVHSCGKVVEVGIVETVTNDGLILWLEQDGPSLRRLIEKTAGTWIKILPPAELHSGGPAKSGGPPELSVAAEVSPVKRVNSSNVGALIGGLSAPSN